MSIGAARLFLKLFQLIGQFSNIDYILWSAPLVLAAASRTLCFTTKRHKYIHHIVFPIDDQTRVAVEAKTDVTIGSRLEDKISILANDLGSARSRTMRRRGSRGAVAPGVSLSLTYALTKLCTRAQSMPRIRSNCSNLSCWCSLIFLTFHTFIIHTKKKNKKKENKHEFYPDSVWTCSLHLASDATLALPVSAACDVDCEGRFCVAGPVSAHLVEIAPYYIVHTLFLGTYTYIFFCIFFFILFTIYIYLSSISQRGLMDR